MKFTPFDFPRVPFTRSQLKPIVGTYENTNDKITYQSRQILRLLPTKIELSKIW